MSIVGLTKSESNMGRGVLHDVTECRNSEMAAERSGEPLPGSPATWFRRVQRAHAPHSAPSPAGGGIRFELQPSPAGAGRNARGERPDHSIGLHAAASTPPPLDLPLRPPHAARCYA